MSYSIQWDRKAFELEKNEENKGLFEEFGITMWESHYFLFELIGSNNLFSHCGRKARSWRLVTFGEKGEVIRHVTKEIAHYAEGGMLQFQNGWTKPENFIKRQRKALNNASILNRSQLEREIGFTGATLKLWHHSIEKLAELRGESERLDKTVEYIFNNKEPYQTNQLDKKVNEYSFAGDTKKEMIALALALKHGEGAFSQKINSTQNI